MDSAETRQKKKKKRVQNSWTGWRKIVYIIGQKTLEMQSRKEIHGCCAEGHGDGTCSNGGGRVLVEIEAL